MSRAEMPPLPEAVDIHDTPLRDGSQHEGLWQALSDSIVYGLLHADNQD